MFIQVKKLLALFDAGLLSERGLAMALEYDAKHKARPPAR